jgi:type I restriction enzyme S subunit
MSVISISRKLGDVATLEKGKPPERQPYGESDAETYLTPEYLRHGIAAEPIKASRNAVRVQDGDTIVLWDGSNAGEVLKGRDGVLASTMMRLRPSASFDHRYFFYAVKNWESFLKGQTSGSGIPHVDREVLGRLEIWEFSEPQQATIANVLLMVDRAIEQTEALVAKQQRMNAGLLQDMLARGIDDNGKLRSEHTHEFKDSPLGRIPAEWNVTSLDAVSEFITSGSRGWAQYYGVEGSIFLRIGNLTRDHINLRLDDIVRVIPPRSAEGKRTSVVAGDLLISITADLGIIGVIPKGFEPAFVNQHIALARVVPTRANSRFVGWFLSGREGQAQFERLNESGAKAGLNLATVSRLCIPTMTPSEQERIVAVLDAATQRTRGGYRCLSKLRLLKKSLMQDLLSARKHVTPLLEAQAVTSVRLPDAC